MIRPRTTYVVGALLVAAATARADETIYVIDDAPADKQARDRDRALGDAPFVTVLHADEHAPTASVGDALATTAGVQLSSLGGLGAYQTISVRGAAPGHTEVLIDGLPLARIAAVTTDLGRFSMASFGTVELYRGAVPVEMGGAGVGGAVNLVTALGRGANGERMDVSAGVGSYGAMHLRARYGDAYGAHGQVKSATTIGYQGAAGDFRYFSDNGTLLNKNDDTYLTRENNRFDRLDASTRAGNDNLVGGVRASWQRQGLPGATSAPTMKTRLSTLDLVGDAQGSVSIGKAIARQVGYVLVEHQTLDDPDGELSLGTIDRTYTTLSGGASSTWHVGIATQRATGGIELRGDHFSDHPGDVVDPDITDSPSLHTYSGNRVGGAVTAALDLALNDRLVVTPAMRLDLERTAPTPMTIGPTAGTEIDPRWDTAPSPRLTAREMLRDDLALKGSVGRYSRLPTLTEVFGNRGFILGAPDLKPETGSSSDVGLVWAPAKSLARVDRILVQADAFASRSHDTIAFVTTAGFTARAINLDDTQSYGAELIAAARFAELLTINAAYTRLETAQLSGDMNLRDNPVPRRPGHIAYGRAELGHQLVGRDVAVWGDANYQSKSTLDQTALRIVPARVLVGAGARVELVHDLSLAGTVSNLFDTRTESVPLDPAPSPTFTSAPTALVDITGFPLPGRSFYLSLEWTH
ncbi:MAG TPA: TonB-dependent receptor [Kofleriaceae bacterium]|jgi:iron complex outermembrane receptor protein